MEKTGIKRPYLQKDKLLGEPEYFDILTKVDQEKYKDLQKYLAFLLKRRSKRNYKKEDMQEWMERIKSFCIQKDSDDGKRCFVCGIFWTQGGIALNIDSLQKLLPKSRSTVNTTLRILGYKKIFRGTYDPWELFKSMMPDIQIPRKETKRWSLRVDSNTADIQQLKDFVTSSDNWPKGYNKIKNTHEEEFDFDIGDFEFIRPENI